MPQAPTTLNYEAAVVPGRYEWAMENERAKMLRRRFLWFTGTLTVLSLLFSPINIVGLVSSKGGAEWRAQLISFVTLLVQLAATIWAFWYAKRQVRNERRLYAIAFWLVVGLGLTSLVASRVAGVIGLQEGYKAGQLAKQAKAEGRDPTTQPKPVFYFELDSQRVVEVREDEATTAGDAVAAVVESAPRLPVPRGSVEAPTEAEEVGETIGKKLASTAATGPPLWVVSLVALVAVWWSIFVTHFFACLFLPWKVKEAWRPAQWLLLAALLILVLDLFTGNASLPFLILGIIFLPLSPLPGLGWCWWRHSAFRQRYRLSFVSDQFRQIENDLAGARRVHDSVLPPPRKQGPVRVAYAYEPAREIGGDLIFVHPRQFDPEHPDQPVSVVVLDVAGHGIAAALAVNRLSGELERLFAEHPDLRPDRLMSMLNRYIHLTLARHSAFVTGFAVRVDPHAKRPLSICGAGHPDAFLCSDDDVKRLGSEAMMLGVVPPEAFVAPLVEHDLDPGEVLMLYTDGAAEARNTDGDMVTIAGVCDYAADARRDGGEPHLWPGAMLNRVAAFRNAPPEDDTLVAVVYRPTH